MIAKTSFNSKLLLFGEYGLMVGAMALSIPFSKFSGRLSFDLSGSNQQSTAEIQNFLQHFRSDKSPFGSVQFDDLQLEKDLGNGLFFDSNIPQQYGLGSSGALVAALFNAYTLEQKKKNDLSFNELKIIFAQLESHFHGRSSGLDPLTSFLNQPLLVESAKNIRPVSFSLEKQDFICALIDTHCIGPTGPLVNHFMNQMSQSDFRKAIEEQFIPVNNSCIESVLKGDLQNFFVSLEQLIRFQLAFFKRMIPLNFHQIISEALDKEVFIKLLGSGGGGYLIAFSKSGEKLKTWANENKIDYLIVN